MTNPLQKPEGAGLTAEKCVPCEGGVPPLSGDAAADLHRMLNPAWTLRDKSIVRELKFKNFADAFAFATRVAMLAEAEGHHPDLEIGWGRLAVTLTTHAAGGLTRNDFIVAGKLDALTV